MNSRTRRRFLQSSLAAGVAALPFSSRAGSPAEPLRIAPFRFDVTPPIGHPLCGGWITPVVDHEDSEEAIGYVLLGAGKPIVVCAVDWTGICNAAHLAWRTAMAEAAGTTPDRVAVQCVHQHDAPFVSLFAEQMVSQEPGSIHTMQPEFFQTCLDRARAAVKAALPSAVPVTHVAQGEGIVEKVASNRRIAVNAQGKVYKTRYSACKDPELIAMPEGLVDPLLKTVAFYSGDQKVVACHYYATHPMSHYGSGHVSSDFVGLARKRRQKEEPACTHIYFTGGAGNITAGKYNDGSHEARVLLTNRMYAGIAASEKTLRPVPVGPVSWKAHNFLPPVNPVFTPDQFRVDIANLKNAPVKRIHPAMQLEWMEHVKSGPPIVLSALHVGTISILHLPAECFVEYQLRAQKLTPDRFVATAAYGDGGPWYIPVKEAYPQGGYEVTVANCSDEVDDLLTKGIKGLLGVS